MGGTIRSKEVQTFVRDEGDNLVLDGSATTIFGLQLEDSLEMVLYEKKHSHLPDHLVLVLMRVIVMVLEMVTYYWRMVRMMVSHLSFLKRVMKQ